MFIITSGHPTAFAVKNTDPGFGLLMIAPLFRKINTAHYAVQTSPLLCEGVVENDPFPLRHDAGGPLSRPASQKAHWFSKADSFCSEWAETSTSLSLSRLSVTLPQDTHFIERQPIQISLVTAMWLDVEGTDLGYKKVFMIILCVRTRVSVSFVRPPNLPSDV